ncbi:MAG: hypothetical protein HKM07_05845 [Chlamydiae bacterium]|jgi:DNA polymerase IIIc chi subunit|nr:hypothetical protein [Chlamydiota bacterium]
MNPNCKIIFVSIQTNSQKIDKLCLICKDFFLKKAPLLLLTESSEASQFLDVLLWKYPKTSFLPHGLTPSKELLLLSMTPSGDCQNIFNLTSKPLELSKQVQTIYEFEDFSSPEKQEISKKKFTFYRALGFSISSE